MGNCFTTKQICIDCKQMATYRGIYVISRTKFSPKQQTFDKSQLYVCLEYKSLPESMSQFCVSVKPSAHAHEFVNIVGQGMKKVKQIEYLFVGCDKCVLPSLKPFFEHLPGGFSL